MCELKSLPPAQPPVEDGGVPIVAADAHPPRAFAVLDLSVYQDMRWCADCAGEKLFLQLYEVESGRVGICLGCEQEKFVPFSREVA